MLAIQFHILEIESQAISDGLDVLKLKHSSKGREHFLTLASVKCVYEIEGIDLPVTR
jgi:hypothetical protein